MDMLTGKITFSTVTAANESLILNWFKKPHVQAWFHGEGLKNSIDSLRKFVTNQNTYTNLWLAPNANQREICTNVVYGRSDSNSLISIFHLILSDAINEFHTANNISQLSKSI